MGRMPWHELACTTNERSKQLFRDRTGRHLNMLREMSAEFGADFAVLGIHYQYYFPNEPYYEKRFPALGDLLTRYGCAESRGAKYESFLWEHMEAHAIPFASIYDHFTEAKAKNPQRKLWHFFDYHFSASGHELLAEELYRLIRRRIASPTTAEE